MLILGKLRLQMIFYFFFLENNAMRKCILSTLKGLLSWQVLDEDYILS